MSIAGRMNEAQLRASMASQQNALKRVNMNLLMQRCARTVRVSAEQVQALRAFVERAGFVSVPDHDPINIAPTPPFCRWTFASIWCPGPFESKGVRAHFPAGLQQRRQQLPDCPQTQEGKSSQV